MKAKSLVAPWERESKPAFSETYQYGECRCVDINLCNKTHVDVFQILQDRTVRVFVCREYFRHTHELIMPFITLSGCVQNVLFDIAYECNPKKYIESWRELPRRYFKYDTITMWVAGGIRLEVNFFSAIKIYCINNSAYLLQEIMIFISRSLRERMDNTKMIQSKLSKFWRARKNSDKEFIFNECLIEIFKLKIKSK